MDGTPRVRCSTGEEEHLADESETSGTVTIAFHVRLTMDDLRTTLGILGKALIAFVPFTVLIAARHCGSLGAPSPAPAMRAPARPPRVREGNLGVHPPTSASPPATVPTPPTARSSCPPPAAASLRIAARHPAYHTGRRGAAGGDERTAPPGTQRSGMRASSLKKNSAICSRMMRRVSGSARKRGARGVTASDRDV